jgi:hypothetical protein
MSEWKSWVWPDVSGRSRGPRGFLAAAPISVALLNAVRGTFAYHKLPVPSPGTPSLEQTFEIFRKVPNYFTSDIQFRSSDTK